MDAAGLTAKISQCQVCAAGYHAAFARFELVAVQPDGPTLLQRCRNCGTIWVEELREAHMIDAVGAQRLALMDEAGSSATTSIPSAAYFAHARAKMQERDRGLSEVRSRVLERYGDSGLHEVFVLYSDKADLLAAYLFFVDRQQAASAQAAGLAARIEETVRDELHAVGRGERSKLNVRIEIDSHENVVEQFDGDYYARLR